MGPSPSQLPPTDSTTVPSNPQWLPVRPSGSQSPPVLLSGSQYPPPRSPQFLPVTPSSPHSGAVHAGNAPPLPLFPLAAVQPISARSGSKSPPPALPAGKKHPVGSLSCAVPPSLWPMGGGVGEEWHRGEPIRGRRSGSRVTVDSERKMAAVELRAARGGSEVSPKCPQPRVTNGKRSVGSLLGAGGHCQPIVLYVHGSPQLRMVHKWDIRARPGRGASPRGTAGRPQNITGRPGVLSWDMGTSGCL